MLAQSAAKNLVRDMVTVHGTSRQWTTEDIAHRIAAYLRWDPGDVLISDITRVDNLLQEAVVVVRFPNTRTRRTTR